MIKLQLKQNLCFVQFYIQELKFCKIAQPFYCLSSSREWKNLRKKRKYQHKNRALVYSDKIGDSENGTEEGGDQASGTEKVSQEFTEKTDLLLEYIERTYLADGYVLMSTLWCQNQL